MMAKRIENVIIVIRMPHKICISISETLFHYTTDAYWIYHHSTLIDVILRALVSNPIRIIYSCVWIESSVFNNHCRLGTTDKYESKLSWCFDYKLIVIAWKMRLIKVCVIVNPWFMVASFEVIEGEMLITTIIGSIPYNNKYTK